MDAERRRHPWSSQSRPEGVVVIPQVKEGGQVRCNIRQADDDIEEEDFTEWKHPAGFAISEKKYFNWLFFFPTPPIKLSTWV